MSKPNDLASLQERVGYLRKLERDLRRQKDDLQSRLDYQREEQRLQLITQLLRNDVDAMLKQLDKESGLDA